MFPPPCTIVYDLLAPLVTLVISSIMSCSAEPAWGPPSGTTGTSEYSYEGEGEDDEAEDDDDEGDDYSDADGDGGVGSKDAGRGP